MFFRDTLWIRGASKKYWWSTKKYWWTIKNSALNLERRAIIWCLNIFWWGYCKLYFWFVGWFLLSYLLGFFWRFFMKLTSVHLVFLLKKVMETKPIATTTTTTISKFFNNEISKSKLYFWFITWCIFLS